MTDKKSTATPGTRKLIGLFMLIASLVIYPLIGSVLHNLFLVNLPMAVQLIFLAIMGVGWVFPAMWIIRWMSQPPAPADT